MALPHVPEGQGQGEGEGEDSDSKSKGSDSDSKSEGSDSKPDNNNSKMDRTMYHCQTNNNTNSGNLQLIIEWKALLRILLRTAPHIDERYETVTKQYPPSHSHSSHPFIWKLCHYGWIVGGLLIDVLVLIIYG